LTKFYGDYPAAQDISFDVASGQIVGFLGPNGAGKTTTMRILAGYLTATSGTATIDGWDIFWRPVEARKRIGYMPENCPLYQEMRVNEYLRFRAGIKGVHGRRRRREIDYVLDRCWLNDVRRQLIGTLSKGYRQRVGLADALLGEPPVLILDEPTVGLDPSQIRETRKLIRELGQRHTILLSTHILPEVEMTCDRVLIIHRGRVAAAGTLRELAGQAGDVAVLVVEAEGDIDHAPLTEVTGVEHVESEPTERGSRLRITTTIPDEVAHRICLLAAGQNWRLREIRPERRTLEDLFIRLTAGEESAA
jgi:ABC-2 type transport system ATP-binding protein